MNITSTVLASLVYMIYSRLLRLDVDDNVFVSLGLAAVQIHIIAKMINEAMVRMNGLNVERIEEEIALLSSEITARTGHEVDGGELGRVSSAQGYMASLENALQ